MDFATRSYIAVNYIKVNKKSIKNYIINQRNAKETTSLQGSKKTKHEERQQNTPIA